MTVGSLFTGIGGIDLGFERAGFRVAWHCEKDEYCQRILAKRWPGIPCYPDVAQLTAEEVGPVDVLVGGFPCQDISYAGRGAGIERGARSSLWSHYARLVRELEPRFVVVENVPALVHRGLAVVLADLAESGYDAEWDHIPASALGAPHRRDRIWLIAYERLRTRRVLEDAGSWRGERRRAGGKHTPSTGARCLPEGPDERTGGQWEFEPDMGRVVDGVPARVDRLRALGNAVVPQVAEWVARRVLEVASE